MTRVRYFWYVAARICVSASVAAGAALLGRLCETLGYISTMAWPIDAHGAPATWAAVAPWVWPAACAAGAHVLLSPKQRRPVYLRVPGAMFTYAGVTVDRDAGCRGGCVTGSTGSGKTLSCILPRLHSLCVNEDGRRTGSPPWGGFVCGEKGNEWHTIEVLLRGHGRGGDVRVLRTRPQGAPPGWMAPVRLNLVGMDGIPADTYARLIVETGLSVEEASSRDEFFVPQARDKIAWGLRLTRAVADSRRLSEGATRHSHRPSLLTLFDILTVQESYRRYLLDATAADPPLTGSAPFLEARYQLENNYWNQPPDQLGGVRSTIYNFLVPFAEPEIAEVFCADSTFSLGDIERGTVVTLAVPQRFALQRRYVATLLKSLVYQVVLERFDRPRDDPGWARRNVIVVEQDEWQRHAVRGDCDIDVVREARGAVYAATQSQNAVWLKLGGRDSASPLIANLRNRWICQAATDECAEESSAVVSGRMAREVSYSQGHAGSTTTVSFAERPLLPKRELRTLRPFHVVFAPAEGPWLYRICIAMPAEADGTVPAWWFGDWNPLHWVARALGLPQTLGALRLHPGDRLVPPWRASAPLRAQFRWLLGLDGTFIILGGRRTGARD